jgi:branched-chain amino acid transport system permease protein
MSRAAAASARTRAVASGGTRAVAGATTRAVAWTALVALALALPFFLAPYQNLQFATALAFVPVVAGLALLTGVSGQVSLGHGALFGSGAYAAAILMTRAHAPFALALGGAAVVTGLVGVLVGLPALRVRGMQLALVTLALAVVFTPILLRARGLTGGPAGISLDPVAAPRWSGLASDQWVYLCALLVALASLGVVAALLRGRLGLALRALHDNELTALAAGVDVARAKAIAFGASAALAGAGGAAYAYVIGFVSPESFPLLLGISFLVAMVVGGSASMLGPLLGALFIEFGPDVASNVNAGLAGVVYGAALVAVLLVAPEGATSLPARLRGRRRPALAVPVQQAEERR